MLTAGTLLQGRYRIVRAIGQGGFGAVYEARDEHLGSTVALKETLCVGGLARRAFEREARLLANLSHPALPLVIDHFFDDAGQFLVMQFVPGEDLGSRLATGDPLTPDEILRWADQLLDALDYLHTQEEPVIHHDIKPENLKLTPRGRIVLLDFGLARGRPTGVTQLDPASVHGFTQDYAPLEQIEDESCDARTDLFSLAVTLYHLLTGVLPPDAVTRATAVVGAEPDPLRPAHEVNGAVSPAVAAVLQAALALHPKQRFASAAAMRAALREATDDPTGTMLPPFANNLPESVARFVGREAELTEVKDLLATHRLVTLTGPGGSGKTRLALQVGTDLRAAFPDGVWMAELGALADPTLVPGTVAEVLGLREEPGRPLLATLAEALRPRRLLVILDTCEHLIAACAALASTLRRDCPGVRLLATSRQALDIPGEVVRRVPSLPVPDPGEVPPLEQLTAYASVQLFLDRATAAHPTFALTDQNARAVAEICRRLDGIPLALELAAARVKMLTAEQIATRLDDRFRLLTGGSRMALPRQRTLRATMDWSYDLLSVGERLLWPRLAVFAGGFTLEAAERICSEGGIEAPEVLDVLSQLVDKSLVVVEEPRGEARYRLLETVRAYAAETLEAATTDAAALGGRHRDWYLAQAEQAEQGLQGPEQATWMQRLDQEHDNLRAALARCEAEFDNSVPTSDEGQQASILLGLRLAGALGGFWIVRGYFGEGRRWLETWLTHGADAPPAPRAKALNAVGNLAFLQGHHEQARAWHEEALAVRRMLNDQAGVAGSLSNLGGVAQARGEYARAATLHAEALALRRALDDQRGIGISLNNLGGVARAQGDYARATALAEEALALRRALGDARGVAMTLGNLGILAQDQGDYARAGALYEEGLAHVTALGDRPQRAALLGDLGQVALWQGNLARAMALHEEALALRREMADQPGIALGLSNLGQVARAQGEYVHAAALQREALALYGSIGDQRGVADCLEGLAAVACGVMDFLRAARLFGAAAELREAMGTPLPPADRLDYDAAVAMVRTGLGEKAFAAARTQGQAMSYVQILAYALEQPLLA